MCYNKKHMIFIICFLFNGVYGIMNKKFIITISWVLVFLWMLIIFRLSSQVAEDSNGLSLGITDLLQKTLERFAQTDSGSLNHLVRKGAHFSAYLLLAVLSSNAVRQSGIRGLKSLAAALGICVLYAASDEIHQLFVAGRSGQPLDVLIDSLGACVGIGIFTLVKHCRLGKNRRRLNKQST